MSAATQTSAATRSFRRFSLSAENKLAGLKT